MIGELHSLPENRRRAARALDQRGPFPSIAVILAVLLVVTLTCVGISRYSYWATVAVFGIAGGLLILRSPFLGFLIVVASLPFETAGMLGDPDAPGAVSITKLAGVATMGSAVLDAFLRRTHVDFPRIFNPLSVLVCLMSVATIASAMIHPTLESIRESVRFVTIVLFFLMTVHLVHTRQRLRRVVLTWVIVATVVSIQSLVQRKFGSTVGSEDWAPTAGTVVDVSEEGVGVMIRTSGTFTHPVWLALYLCLTIPLTLYVIWTGRTLGVRMAGSLAILLQAAAIVVTYSRMGYIALVLGFVIFSLRRRGGALIVLWTGLLVVATSPFWPETIRNRIDSILDYTSSASSVTRVGQQLVGWWMFRDSPFTGVGPGNFEDNVPRYADYVSDTLRIEAIGAHNMYVQVMAELGLPGIVVIVLILISAWRRIERARRTGGDPDDKLLYEALGTSLLVFALSAVLIHAQYQKEWWLLVALIAAASWIAHRTASTHAPPARSS